MKTGGSRGFVKSFFTLCVLVAIAFVGISFGKPYYRYNTFRSHVKDYLLSDPGINAETIKKTVLEQAAEDKVPVEEDNVDVTVTQTKIVKVTATWSEVVDFWGYYTKRLDFEMHVEG